MSIISGNNLSLTFGHRDIFEGISVNLPNDGKVGLVGPNGVGKTSLLRILAGMSAPTTGSVHRARGSRLGYLAQEAVEVFAGHENTVHGEMLTVFAHLQDQAQRLQEMEARMASGDVAADLLTAYGEEQEAYERAGGYDYELRIRQVLEGLGFPPELWETPLSHLSGGQKTRALLARLLLEQPTLLILDEPTNHLDVEAIEWLERTLRAWAGALLVVSHDRYFLDKVVNGIWEMHPNHVESYRGNYSAYLHQRQERWERNEQIFESEMERLWKEFEIIERYFAWRKFTEARGRLLRLGRELVAIEHFGILGIQGKSWSQFNIRSPNLMTLDEARSRLKGIKRPMSRPPQLHLRLKNSGRSGQIVLRSKDLAVGYNGKPLFTAGDLHLERQERAALLGSNGAGKTTFLRTVLGEIPPVRGEVQPGASLKIGYFAQAHDGLDEARTVIDELLAHREMTTAAARSFLAQYLFRGDDVWKPVGALSGGERSRLALAILTAEGVNFLILDEPTNHLDIPAQEVLQANLERFDGTILMVSHDRYLVDQLATQVWEIRDGRLEVFNGTYQELLEEREGDQSGPPAPAVAARKGKQAPAQAGEKSERKLARLEDRIAEAEVALAGCDRKLVEASEAGDLRGIRELTEERSSAQTDLEQLMAQWAILAEEAV